MCLLPNVGMIDKAEERGFKPKFVMFDVWYASVKNLKSIRKKQWHFLTRLKSNRSVNPDNTKNKPLKTIDIPPEGTVVHLKKYDFVKVWMNQKEKTWLTNHGKRS